jgi:hypothetical protein
LIGPEPLYYETCEPPNRAHSVALTIRPVTIDPASLLAAFIQVVISPAPKDFFAVFAGVYIKTDYPPGDFLKREIMCDRATVGDSEQHPKPYQMSWLKIEWKDEDRAYQYPSSKCLEPRYFLSRRSRKWLVRDDHSRTYFKCRFRAALIEGRLGFEFVQTYFEWFADAIFLANSAKVILQRIS